MELIATNLGTNHLFPSPILVTAYRITRERDDVPASEVIATKWFCVFMRTEATHPKARSHKKYFP